MPKGVSGVFDHCTGAEQERKGQEAEKERLEWKMGQSVKREH